MLQSQDKKINKDLLYQNIMDIADSSVNRKKIFFILSSFQGHFNKFILLAKYYLSAGYAVFFIAYDDLIEKYAHEHKGFNFIQTASKSINIVFINVGDISSHLEEIEKKYVERKIEICNLITSYQPIFIYLDEFCSSDLLFLLPNFNAKNLAVLSTFLPSFPNEIIPPHDEFAMPGSHVKAIWESRKIHKIHKGKHDFYLNKFDREQIDKKFKIWNFNQIHPAFSNIQKWYLVAEELEFFNIKLKPWEKYMGPMIDLSRHETIDTKCRVFLQLAKQDKRNKIIFLSFGTVIYTFIPEPVLLAFYENVIKIAKDNPFWFFFLQLPASLYAKLRPVSMNIAIFQFCPQLTLLQAADLFITHGGGNSIHESIYFNTPMIVIPPVKKFDYNGNASRLVYHGIAETASVNNDLITLQEKINTVLTNEKFKIQVKKMSELFIHKYKDNFLDELHLPFT